MKGLQARTQGIWYALGAYGSWGLLPFYWKRLAQVPSLEVLGHRVVWSCLLLCCLAWLLRRKGAAGSAGFSVRVVRVYAIASLLIAVNWLTYIWAVQSDRIVESSLGYFINPLANVLLGVAVLGERLRRGQWAAVGLASIGVVYLAVTYGSLPWIALVLAISFALYGLVKKLAPLGSLDGLALETVLLCLPAVGYLFYLESRGQGAFLHGGAAIDGLLVGTGLVTTAPLVMFASAARRIPLSLMGLLQYLSPTLQFLLGVLVYREPFTVRQFVGFGIVWTALAVFAVEGAIAHRRQAGRAAVLPGDPAGKSSGPEIDTPDEDDDNQECLAAGTGRVD